MKIKLMTIVLLMMGMGLNIYADSGKATPRELFDKVGQAAIFLLENGEAGLSAMSERASDNPFIWKDTYVFVFKCRNKALAAHPNTKLIGNPVAWNLKDPNGKKIMQTLCKVAASNKNGGWFEYMWPKKQSKTSKTTAKKLGDIETIARKVTFCIQVPDTPYQVAAGIYDDKITIKQLNDKIKDWMK